MLYMQPNPNLSKARRAYLKTLSIIHCVCVWLNFNLSVCVVYYMVEIPIKSLARPPLFFRNYYVEVLYM